MRKVGRREVTLRIEKTTPEKLFDVEMFAVTIDEADALVNNSECADTREETFNTLMITKERFEALGYDVEEMFDYYLSPKELMTIILLDMADDANELIAVWAV